jgi:hypothetical protein
MRKTLMIVGVAIGLAVALSVDICVLLGALPISAAACISIAAAIIVTATKSSNPKITAPRRGFAIKNAATALNAAENGEAYVITGKSIHNNPGELKRPDRQS